MIQLVRHKLLTFVLLLLALVGVSGQASENNPFFWQVIVEYDIGRSNQTQRYVPGTSMKLHSQDFQTVSPHSDLYGHNQRLLLDFGDGCPETTIDDIQRLNGNTATSPSMMSQPSIALIQRGGRCSMWSDKVNHTISLSEAYELNIGAALLYDNVTSSSSDLVQSSTDNSSYPTWTAPLPESRNIHYMADNDISLSAESIFIAVYFCQNQYGRVLLDMVRNYTSMPTANMRQRYVQLTMFLSETTFKVNDNNNNGKDNNDIWSAFTGERGYLAYIIAAGAGLFLVVIAVVFLRWCRASRRAHRQAREPTDPEAGIQLRPTGHTAVDRRRKTTLIKLNDMCPVQSLSVELQTKNSVCAICLEEMQEGDLVRVLPCVHAFCVACIDVWLTKKSCLCPICKYDCDPVEEEESSSDSETRNNSAVDSRASETHESRSPETAAGSSNSSPSSPVTLHVPPANRPSSPSSSTDGSNISSSSITASPTPVSSTTNPRSSTTNI